MTTVTDQVIRHSCCQLITDTWEETINTVTAILKRKKMAKKKIMGVGGITWHFSYKTFATPLRRVRKEGVLQGGEGNERKEG